MTKPDYGNQPAGKPSRNDRASTVEPKVEIDSEVTRNIRQHARAHIKTEVCGVLIGEFEHNTIDIRVSIEALNAAQAGTHVTFTQDAWEAIYRIKDDLYPNERIVGWYHSHPGFGVFLSDHDLFIQQNFFSSPGQVAWVYDPHTDEEGCFGWVSGEIHRLSQLSVMDRNGDGAEHTPKLSQSGQSSSGEEEDEFSLAPPSKGARSAPAWLRYTSVFLTHATMLLLGFAVAYFLFPHVLAELVDPATGNHVICDFSYHQRCTPLPEDLQAPSAPLPDPFQRPGSSTAPAPSQPANPGSHK